jgi:hypothetical protein
MLLTVTVSRTTAAAQLWAADHEDSELLSVDLRTCPDGFEWRSDVRLGPLGFAEVTSRPDASGPFLVSRSARLRRVATAPLVSTADQFAKLGVEADEARRQSACEYAGQHGLLGYGRLFISGPSLIAESWELWRSESSAAHEISQMIRWAARVRKMGDEASRNQILDRAVRVKASEIIDKDRLPRFGGLAMTGEVVRREPDTLITLPEEAWSSNDWLADVADNAVAVWLNGRLDGQVTAHPYPRRELRYRPANGLAAVHLGLALLLTRPNPAGRRCLHCRKPITDSQRSTKQFCNQNCRKAASRARADT